MGLENPGNLQETREKRIELETEKTLKDWLEKTPVYLVSSSKVRLEGLKKLGFKEGNIKAVEVPNEIEVLAMDDYLENFEPSWLDPSGTRTMEKSAKVKADFLEQQGIPTDSLWFAFDTMPLVYENKDSKDYGKFESWKGKTERKPENIVKARQATKEMFLQAMLNYLRFSKYLEDEKQTSWEKLSTGENEKEFEKYSKMDFASGIHVKTSFAVHFPNEKEVLVNTDRIIAKPQTLFKIIDSLDLKNIDEKNISLEILKSLANKNGKSVEDSVDQIIDEVYQIMEENKVEPQNISGGVAYNLDKVKTFLDIKEMADVKNEFPRSEKPDSSIYSGFPKRLFCNVIGGRAAQLAEAKIDKK